MKTDIELIVLNHTKFKDNAIVLHTLSEPYGRRSFLVRIGKKTPMALFFPLNILEGEVTENPKSDLWYLGRLTSKTPLNGIRGNVGKNSLSLFMSEVLFRTLKEDGPQEGLFDWCVKEIMTLDSLESLWSNFHIWFLLELCAALGFRPTFTDIAPFSQDHLKEIKSLMDSSFEEAMRLPLTGDKRSALCEDILKYLSFHTESSINIKSLAVLRELF